MSPARAGDPAMRRQLAFYGRMALLPALATSAGAGLLMAGLSGRELRGVATSPIDRSARPIMAFCRAATIACRLIARGWYFSRPAVLREAA